MGAWRSSHMGRSSAMVTAGVETARISDPTISDNLRVRLRGIFTSSSKGLRRTRTRTTQLKQTNSKRQVELKPMITNEWLLWKRYTTHKDTMASFNLWFGNLLCSHPQLVGVLPWFAVVIFYVFIIKETKNVFGFLYFTYIYTKKKENIFVFYILWKR